MRIVYLGSPEFAVLPLKRILEFNDKFEVVAVVTNPDKPVGRKQIMTACPVKREALRDGLRVLQYSKIRTEGAEDLKRLAPDVMVTCAFGQILSQEILDIPKFGVINVHASLLPAYRGASPIHYAIKNGEKKTGVTIMRTDIGVDTGDVLMQRSVDIGEQETCGELFERLSVLGADMIVEALDLIASGKAKYFRQDESKATRTGIIKKEHARIDWTESNIGIVNTIRAFNPAPVAFTFIDGQPLKIFKAQCSDGQGRAGEILSVDGKLEVACGKGSVIVEKLQKAGGNAMDVKDFLRGSRLKKGDIFG